VTFSYKKGQSADLLTIAEQLYNAWRNPETLKVYTAYAFSLHPRQKRAGTRHSPMAAPLLRSRAAWLKTDEYGNLLAAIHCGEGAVIAFSAHMDTVKFLSSLPNDDRKRNKKVPAAS
jgi:tripeptide aminopeptidase